MQRREFVILLGAAAAWPIVANAQQQEGMRRIGMLTGIAGEDVQIKARIAAFLQELQKLGWTEGHNFRMDIRAGAGNLRVLRRNDQLKLFLLLLLLLRLLLLNRG